MSDSLAFIALTGIVTAIIGRVAFTLSILFKTKYEGDLKAIAEMLGIEMSRIIPGLPVGCSIFHFAHVGDPFILAWRPTYSQP